MTSTPRNVRLDDDAQDRLAEASGVRGQPQATLMAECINEGLAMREHPGITFHDGPTGRRAALEAGPDVWELAARVETLREDMRPAEVKAAIAEEFDLAESSVEVALRYWADHTEEIDERITRNETARQQLEERARVRHELLSP